MRRLRTLGTVACLLAMTVPALADQGPKWNADPVHSNAQFTATHFGISHVTGTIGLTAATLIVPDGSDIPTSVSATLDPTKVDTRDANRDSDLRSDHFLDVKDFKTVTFQSTQITGTASDFTIVGNLTMRGVTKPVTLHGKFLGRAPGPKGRTLVAYTADGTLKRSDWGMTYANPMPVADNLDLHIEIEASKT